MSDPQPFAQAPDLVRLLDGDVEDSASLAKADLVLRIISNDMRGNIDQLVDQVEGDVLLLDGPGTVTRLVFLPQIPVTEVSLVEVLLLDGTWQTLAPGTDYDWSADGTITRRGWQGWPRRGRSIRVTYDHGFATTPPSLAGVALAAGARFHENPLGMTQEVIADYSYRMGAGGGGVEYTPAEQKTLDSFANGNLA